MAKSAHGKAMRRPARASHVIRGRAPEVVFPALADAALKSGDPDAISDETLQAVLTAAVRIYAAKVERHGDVKPFADGDGVTATEAIVAACGIIRAADLNPFDMAMWFHRMPAR
jgi:hypothetical protein